MFNITATQINTIVATTQNVGGKVPKALTTAIAKYDTVNAKLDRMYIGGTALEDAALAAIDAGQDPAADPEVQRILTSRQIGQEGLTGQLRTRMLQRMLAVLRESVENLIDTWQAPFHEAAAVIVETREALGGIDLNDSQAILARGGDAADQWGRATNANRTIREIVGAWNTLAAEAQFVPGSTHYLMLRFTNPTLEQWEEHSLRERKLTAWEAHALGLPLDLATPTEYMDRIAALDTQRQARERAAIQAEKPLAQANR